MQVKLFALAVAVSIGSSALPAAAQSATTYQNGRGGKAVVTENGRAAAQTANGSKAHTGPHGSGYNGKNSAAYSGKNSSGTYNKNSGAYNVNGKNYQCSGTKDAQGNCVKQ